MVDDPRDSVVLDLTEKLVKDLVREVDAWADYSEPEKVRATEIVVGDLLGSVALAYEHPAAFLDRVLRHARLLVQQAQGERDAQQGVH